MNERTFTTAILSAGLSIYGTQSGNGIFRAQVDHGNEVRFYSNDRIGGSGLNGWFAFTDGAIVASGDTAADVAPYVGPSCVAGDDNGPKCSGADSRWNLANYRAIFQREHCAIGQAAMYGVEVCAVAFTPLYVGGYPCHEDINASPADDFFTYSTPADPEMMPWRCSQPDALRALASAFTPNEERSAWWCTPETGSYGVKMMTLGFSIGKADDQWRKREREVIASVLAALTGFGLHAEIDRDHGWIVLTDHKRPYRVPVLPAELRC